ncbi:MAG: hypothetical protein KTR15_14015 [Phycisphaeraceae bacterium]|nr:hypothetical protein [Phycisphaeraceae bacterium]
MIDNDRQHTAAIDATGLEIRHVSAHFKRRVWSQSAWPQRTAVFHAARHLIAGVVVGLGRTTRLATARLVMRQAAANIDFTRVSAASGPKPIGA